VEAATRSLEVYVTSAGRIPFLEWLESLKDLRARAIIRTRLDRVRLGDLGDCHSLGGGLHELRIGFGPGYRVYFAHLGAETILLLCGGPKRSQKADIARARRYWRDYGSRQDA
jgi:putative addiction module killer protein